MLPCHYELPLVGGKQWRYGVKIWRSSPVPVVQDEDMGTATLPDARRIVYEGRALVQDLGESHPRNTSGMPHLQSDATVFLRDPKREKINLVEPEDTIEVFYPDGRLADGRVQFARELDAAVLVKYL